MRWITLFAVVIAIGAAPLAGQVSTPLSFEVASVKENTSGETRAAFSMPPMGTVSATNVTLQQIIMQAYGVEAAAARFTLLGGPTALMAKRFDILAKPPDNAPPGQAREMLKSLLNERFNLRMHAETRDVPVYGLVVVREGRFGPAFGANPGSCTDFQSARRDGKPIPNPLGIDGQPLCLVNSFGGAPGTIRMRSVGALANLIRSVQGFVDRPIVDATGLTGTFEWDVRFAITPERPEVQAPSIYTAFQEDLGLRFEPRMAPQQVWVVDSVEMPSPN